MGGAIAGSVVVMVDCSVVGRVAMGIGAGIGVGADGVMPLAFGLTGVLCTDRIWESAEIAASCAEWREYMGAYRPHILIQHSTHIYTTSPMREYLYWLYRHLHKNCTIKHSIA